MAKKKRSVSERIAEAQKKLDVLKVKEDIEKLKAKQRDLRARK